MPGSRMNSNYRHSRGHALIIALALVLGLLVFAAAAATVVVQQLKQTKTERDSERALQLAEAGANAYLNMLENGAPANTVTNYGLIPAAFTPPAADLASWTNGVMPIATFKTEIQNTVSTRVPHGNLIYYPSGQTKQCYFAYETTSAPGASGAVTVVAFGWSNGVVRRVQVNGVARGVFDWAAIYGLNPADALDLKNITINGAWGAEGTVTTTGSTTLNGGPSILAAAGITNNVNTSGWPNLTKVSRSLGTPTSDQAANNWARSKLGVTTNLGVEYFRSNNNNATGLRILVQNKSTSKIRELNDPLKPYNVVPNTSSGNAMTFDTSNLTALANTGGMNNSTEQYYGVHIYPGNYYFTSIADDNHPVYIRSFADGSTPASDPLTLYNSAYTSTVVPSNPTTTPVSMATEQNIRIWIGGTPRNTSYANNFTLEDSTYPSRFRIYTANRGDTSGKEKDVSVALKQTNTVVTVLAYNKDASGSYGSISVETQVNNVNGSLIGWNVFTHGTTTVTKPAAIDGGNQDSVLFRATSWKEVP